MKTNIISLREGESINVDLIGKNVSITNAGKNRVYMSETKTFERGSEVEYLLEKIDDLMAECHELRLERNKLRDSIWTLAEDAGLI